MAEKMFLGVVEAVAQRRHQTAQIVLDAVDRGRNMSGANHLLAGDADEIVLVVVGKAQHLVRHHVAQIHDEVPLLVD